jgi:AcrR family transcriptional regulator
MARIEADGEAPLAPSARRQRVLDAAAGLFARGGYHGVGTRQIADSLNIKVASLYFHFRSKEQALEEVCEHGIQCSLDSLDRVLAGATGLVDRLHGLFSTMEEDVGRHGDYMQVYLNERRHLPPEASERLEAMTRRYGKAIRDLFREAKARGELHPTLSAHEASLIAIGALRNVWTFHVEWSGTDAEAYARTAPDALIRAVAAPGPPTMT